MKSTEKKIIKQCEIETHLTIFRKVNLVENHGIFLEYIKYTDIETNCLAYGALSCI